MTRAFFQAINNFALGPLAFVGAYKSLGRNSSFDSLCACDNEIAVFDLRRLAFFAVNLLAFAIGFLPRATSRNILLLSQFHHYKRKMPAHTSGFPSGLPQ
jgi:hypothetical protein